VEQRVQGMGRQLKRFATKLQEYAHLLETQPGNSKIHLIALPTLQDQMHYWSSSLDELRGVFDPNWHEQKNAAVEPVPPSASPPNWSEPR
jgi:hypothetical protein